MSANPHNSHRIRYATPHLILLLEAVSLAGLHLVDVLEEVSHAHRWVELTRVIGRALPPKEATRGGASQEAA